MNKRRDFVGIGELGTTTVSVFKFLSISLFFFAETLQIVCLIFAIPTTFNKLNMPLLESQQNIQRKEKK